MRDLAVLERPQPVEDRPRPQEIRGFNREALTLAFQRGLCVSGVREEVDVVDGQEQSVPVYTVSEIPVSSEGSDLKSIGSHFEVRSQQAFFEAGYVGVGLSQTTLCGGNSFDWMEMTR